MKVSIVAAALGLMFLAGAANAEYDNFTGGITVPSPAERAQAREREKWIDRERARQEIRAYKRQQDQILYDAQWGVRTLDELYGRTPRESASEYLDRVLEENRRRYR